MEVAVTKKIGSNRKVKQDEIDTLKEALKVYGLFGAGLPTASKASHLSVNVEFLF